MCYNYNLNAIQSKYHKCTGYVLMKHDHAIKYETACLLDCQMVFLKSRLSCLIRRYLMHSRRSSRKSNEKCFYFVWHMRNLMYMYMFSVYLESWSIIVKGGPQNITCLQFVFYIRVIAPKIWVAPIINLLWNALKYLKRGKLFLFPIKSSYKK